MKITQKPYGKLSNQLVYLYTLDNYSKANNPGMYLCITNYGGIITHWFVPDRTGKPRDIVLGFNDFATYLGGHPFLGAIVGRFANRIDAGRFTLEGTRYQLAAQAAGNHLHGGNRGFDKYIWHSQTKECADSVSLVLQHHSPDGDEGYPGALDAQVCYTLHRDNRLEINYRATATKTTIVNLTNHSYFNLTGEPSRDITGHAIQINAERYVEVNESQIPTGQLPAVAQTYLDCRQLRNMGTMFSQAPPCKGTNGSGTSGIVDHCYVLQDQPGQLRDAALVEEPSTGIRMALATDNVGVQFYNGNKLAEQNINGKHGEIYPQFGGFCLETQCFPDSPNQPAFPSCVLAAGEEYRHKTVFRFATF